MPPLAPISNRQAGGPPRHPRQPLLLPPEAVRIHHAIVALLDELVELPGREPLNSTFTKRYARIGTLYNRFQRAVIKRSGLQVSCSKACRRCCFHWVEDVYSFEADIIAAYVRAHMPARIDRIIAACRQDEERLVELNAIVIAQLAAAPPSSEREAIDPVELLLASFYQLRRPCPLLSADGTCAVYPVRPLTCRIYVSFSDPQLCDPEHINDSDVATYLCDLEDDANDRLDKLHQRFERFAGITGLRALLPRYLSAALDGPRG
jgi:Fe-S-cluster containining protein